MALTYYKHSPKQVASKSKRRTASNRYGALDIMQSVAVWGPQAGVLDYVTDRLSFEERAVLLAAITLASERGDESYIVWPAHVEQQMFDTNLEDTYHNLVSLLGVYCGVLWYFDGWTAVEVAVEKLASKGFIEIGQLGSFFIPFCIREHTDQHPLCHPLCAWSNQKRVAYALSCTAQPESEEQKNQLPFDQPIQSGHLKLAYPVPHTPENQDGSSVRPPPISAAVRWMGRFLEHELEAGRRPVRDAAASLCMEATGVAWKLCREAFRVAANEIGIKRGRPRNLENMENVESPTPHSPK